MIRYIEQKQTGFSSQRGPSLKSSHHKPPEVHNSSAALRSLKQTNDHLELLRGRLSVLQVHDEKYNNKALFLQKKLQFHHNVQHEISMDKDRKDRYFRQMQLNTERSREKLNIQRRERDDNIKSARNSIGEEKFMEAEDCRQMSKIIDQTVKDIKGSEADHKQIQRQIIQKKEKEQRQNVNNFAKSRVESVKSRQSAESGRVRQLSDEKKKELAYLSGLEAIMLQRQSKSRQAVEESGNKMSEIFSARKLKTKKLAALSTSDRSTRDGIIIMGI